MFLAFEEVKKTLYRALVKIGFSYEKSEILAKTFSESSLDGVYSHGINRFPRFIETVKNGYVKTDAEPTRELISGAIERWNGNLGAGILNAEFSMNRAIELARENGIGAVGLRNTNHWMRGGTYGIQAIKKNSIGICFTNTKPNMPPWGGSIPKLGNNPLVIGIPHKDKSILLDMAMSQFSFGKMTMYARQHENLPFPGGFDDEGSMTNDPEKILNNERTLPIGLWKGAGLSLVLDVLALILSGGDPTLKIGDRQEEYGLSQVFIAISLENLSDEYIDSWIEKILSDISEEGNEHARIYYPGEQTKMRRSRNIKTGIPVDEEIWEGIRNL